MGTTELDRKLALPRRRLRRQQGFTFDSIQIGGGDLRPGRRGGRRGGGDGQAQRRQHRPSHLSLRGRGNITCGGGTDNPY